MKKTGEKLLTILGLLLIVGLDLPLCAGCRSWTYGEPPATDVWARKLTIDTIQPPIY
jgi:hypothetical protein